MPGFDPGMLRMRGQCVTTKPLRAVFKVGKNLGYLFDVEKIISCESRLWPTRSLLRSLNLKDLYWKCRKRTQSKNDNRSDAQPPSKSIFFPKLNVTPPTTTHNHPRTPTTTTSVAIELASQRCPERVLKNAKNLRFHRSVFFVNRLEIFYCALHLHMLC